MGMQLKHTGFQPFGYLRPQFLGLPLTIAVADHIISVSLKGNLWMVIPHPAIKRIVQKKIRQ
jgi:hypothetical protein